MKKVVGILLSLALLAGTAVAAGEFDYAQDITVVSREEGSGTRGAFIEKAATRSTTPPRKPLSPTAQT